MDEPSAKTKASQYIAQTQLVVNPPVSLRPLTEKC